MRTSISSALTAIILLSSTAAAIPAASSTSNFKSTSTSISTNSNGDVAKVVTGSETASGDKSNDNSPGESTFSSSSNVTLSGGNVNDPASAYNTTLSTTDGGAKGSTDTSASAEASSSSSPSSTTVTSSPGGSSLSNDSIVTAASGGNTKFLRGVNLGGWLVLEKWMTEDLFTGAFKNAKDQYDFDGISGAKEALQKHWDSYFTEADIQTLAKAGINALRIPIGFWAYDNQDTPYLKGADEYMKKAIGWARKAGMKVWVDCHGSPGSQNGFDNSGHAGKVDWQSGNNMQRSISVLKKMAEEYGKKEYADVVVGLQLTNEPISWGNNNLGKTKNWAKDAYKAVRSAAENKDLVIVMHDAFKGAHTWTGVAKEVVKGEAKDFGVDTHLYQLFVDADNKLTQKQHIEKACGWGKELKEANTVMPTYVGEWSAATNICVNPDGSTTGGTSCSTSGCQCQSAGIEKWNDKMVEQVRRYVEAQLDTFESSSSGYFIWSAKAPGGWGFLNGIKAGAIPNPVTERKYPGQCGGTKTTRSAMEFSA